MEDYHTFVSSNKLKFSHLQLQEGLGKAIDIKGWFIKKDVQRGIYLTLLTF